MSSCDSSSSSPGILWEGSPVQGRFERRLNRFVAEVSLGSRTLRAHVPNSGRLAELLKPGNEVYLLTREPRGRKTSHDLILARAGDTLVSVDARIPKTLVERAVVAQWLPELAGWSVAGLEPRVGAGRLDLRLSPPDRAGPDALVETKSVTLVEGNRARFPDAPTARGARHLRELIVLRESGQRAAVVFVVQRDDADSFGPNWATDPEFGEVLGEACQRGVEVYAYSCRVCLRGIWMDRSLPLSLEKGV